MDIDILKDPPSRAELDSESQALQKRLRLLRVAGLFSLALVIFSFFKMLEGIGEKGPLQIAVALGVVIGVSTLGTLATFKYKNDGKEEALQCATPDDCIRIQTYLADPDIKAYRDKVVDQSRKFVQAEVEAMKQHYEGWEKREACRAVYGVTPGEA